MTLFRSLALALALLLIASGPASAFYGLSRPESYLAYRVRVVRHESYSKLTQAMINIAGRRAYEISFDFRHVDLHTRGVPLWCWWGEIIAWTAIDDPTDPYRRSTASWTIRAWLASPSHRTVLLGRWTRYGTGMLFRNGRWYLVVDFARC
jgi:hypothetical protein